jgi:hypothetical protein
VFLYADRLIISRLTLVHLLKLREMEKGERHQRQSNGDAGQQIEETNERLHIYNNQPLRGYVKSNLRFA